MARHGELRGMLDAPTSALMRLPGARMAAHGPLDASWGPVETAEDSTRGPHFAEDESRPPRAGAWAQICFGTERRGHGDGIFQISGGDELASRGWRGRGGHGHPDGGVFRGHGPRRWRRNQGGARCGLGLGGNGRSEPRGGGAKSFNQLGSSRGGPPRGRRGRRAHVRSAFRLFRVAAAFGLPAARRRRVCSPRGFRVGVALGLDVLLALARMRAAVEYLRRTPSMPFAWRSWR